MQQFKIGDLVQLRSGSPLMTVKKYESTDEAEVTCQWFDKNEELQEKAFHQDTLVTSFDQKTSHYPING